MTPLLLVCRESNDMTHVSNTVSPRQLVLCSVRVEWCWDVRNILTQKNSCDVPSVSTQEDIALFWDDLYEMPQIYNKPLKYINKNIQNLLIPFCLHSLEWVPANSNNLKRLFDQYLTCFRWVSVRVVFSCMVHWAGGLNWK